MTWPARLDANLVTKLVTSLAAFALATACAPPLPLAVFNTGPFETTGPYVYFANIADGAEVPYGPLRLQFGLSGYGVAPAGVAVSNTGHFHLLRRVTGVTPGAPPTDPWHVVMDFDGGQTETVLDELTPGEHTFMLVLTDANHLPFEPSIQSEPITITVGFEVIMISS